MFCENGIGGGGLPVNITGYSFSHTCQYGTGLTLSNERLVCIHALLLTAAVCSLCASVDVAPKVPVKVFVQAIYARGSVVKRNKTRSYVMVIC